MYDIYTCVCVYMYACIYIYIYIYTHRGISLYTYIYIIHTYYTHNHNTIIMHRAYMLDSPCATHTETQADRHAMKETMSDKKKHARVVQRKAV